MSLTVLSWGGRAVETAFRHANSCICRMVIGRPRRVSHTVLQALYSPVMGLPTRDALNRRGGVIDSATQVCITAHGRSARQMSKCERYLVQDIVYVEAI